MRRTSSGVGDGDFGGGGGEEEGAAPARVWGSGAGGGGTGDGGGGGAGVEDGLGVRASTSFRFFGGGSADDAMIGRGRGEVDSFAAPSDGRLSPALL